VHLEKGSLYEAAFSGDAGDKLVGTGRPGVAGAVDIANSILKLAVRQYEPRVGNLAFILSNDNADVIKGRFSGLPGDMAVFTQRLARKDWRMRIRYIADFVEDDPAKHSETGGNDISLRFLGLVPEPSISLLLLVGAAIGGPMRIGRPRLVRCRAGAGRTEENGAPPGKKKSHADAQGPQSQLQSGSALALHLRETLDRNGSCRALNTRPAASHHAVHQQDQKRAEDRPDPTGRGRFGQWQASKRITDGAAHERSDDAEDRRQDESHRLSARHQKPRNGAYDQPKNDPANNVHGWSSSGKWWNAAASGQRNRIQLARRRKAAGAAGVSHPRNPSL
jgi:hypothetical protein